MERIQIQLQPVEKFDLKPGDWLDDPVVELTPEQRLRRDKAVAEFAERANREPGAIVGEILASTSLGPKMPFG